MGNYNIEPYVGVDGLKLGMTAMQIEALHGEPSGKIKRGSDPGLLSDAYTDFFVYYKNPGICQAIEFHKPARVLFENHNLLEEPYLRIVEHLQQLDSEIIIDDDGLTSYKLGIGIYAPSADGDPTYVAESVIVFERGYYD